ncbi:hypothetical protein GPUN_1382 [Glaciecola punicea ACAM 611]|uniref:Uncharacterized protein n=1 Tax=Glaciecola punicea ACAM 611 TaxID=1121923 RepID=H5TB29_9ALTE|nr:hypothetical protein GPUN_1382 [Glaciecola punicea ACAM 611]
MLDIFIIIFLMCGENVRGRRDIYFILKRHWQFNHGES